MENNGPARLLDKVHEFVPKEEKVKHDDTESITIIQEEKEKPKSEVRNYIYKKGNRCFDDGKKLADYYLTDYKPNWVEETNAKLRYPYPCT